MIMTEIYLYYSSVSYQLLTVTPDNETEDLKNIESKYKNILN